MSLVISGEVPEGVIISTPAGMATELAVASTAPEQAGPTMASTRSMLTALVAASVAFCGLQALSPSTASSFPPLRMPPCSLTCATASFEAAAIGGASAAIGPEMAAIRPILTSWAWAGAATTAAPSMAPTTAATVLFFTFVTS